jgi:hypothetical protein
MMTHSLEEIEKLLFTNLEGNREQLQDIIDAGLDEDMKIAFQN